MPKKRNSGKKNIQNIQSIGCPHAHTHLLPQLGINTCFSCMMIYHSDCEYRKIEDSKEATKSIKILQTYLDDIKVTAQVNRLHIQYKSFFDELNILSSELDSLSKRLGVAMIQNNHQEFAAVKDEALKLMQKLENSQIMIVYSRHRVHSLLDRRVNGAHELKDETNVKKSLSKDKISESEALTVSKEESKYTSKDDYISLMENYAEKYTELESKVKHLDDAKKDLESKMQILNESKKETEEKCLRLESKVENFEKMHTEDEKKIEKLVEEVKGYIVEIEELKTSWDVHIPKIKELYKAKVGKALAAIDENIELELSLDQQPHLDVLNSISCIKLPNMKRIKIDKVKNNSKEFLQFLTDSMPKDLLLTTINKIMGERLDAEYYMKGLQSLAQAASKEVYLCYLNFTKESFENFMKSCTKTTRLTLYCCKFVFSSELDLSGPTYNISYLSFRCLCNNANFSSKSGELEKIIKAIANSKLKDSLKH